MSTMIFNPVTVTHFSDAGNLHGSARPHDSDEGTGIVEQNSAIGLLCAVIGTDMHPATIQEVYITDTKDYDSQVRLVVRHAAYPDASQEGAYLFQGGQALRLVQIAKWFADSTGRVDPDAASYLKAHAHVIYNPARWARS